MSAGIAAIAALTVFMAVWGFMLYTDDDRVVPSPEATVARKKSLDVNVLDRIADAIGRPFTGFALGLLAPNKAKLRKRIDAAGRPNGMTVESYARQTVGYIMLFGALALWLMSTGYTITGALCLVACFQKDALLFSRARERQDQIQRVLPDFLDVLSVTVSAGLSFRHALARVIESMPGPLADEFNVALRQMELGTSRRDAFEDLRDRNRSPALNQMVTALLQAEELGAPLVGALNDISVDMRRESAQWAKRKAQKTTPRITGISTALTMPALMLIVLGAMYFGMGPDLGGTFDAP